MKLAIIFGILLIIIGGCYVQQELPESKISGTQDLVLTEQDLQELGMTAESECQTEEQTSYDLSDVEYTFCSYTIDSLIDTKVIIELKKFSNYESLNDSYLYDSSHLFGAKGLISENTFGEQSRFRVNSKDDYEAEFNDPNIYYYHLWITKYLYLIHITSSGRSEEAKGYIIKIGQQILSKF